MSCTGLETKPIPKIGLKTSASTLFDPVEAMGGSYRFYRKLDLNFWLV